MNLHLPLPSRRNGPSLDPTTDGPVEELAHFPQLPLPAGEPLPAAPERAVVWAVAAVLAGYPDDDLPAALPRLRRALTTARPFAGGAATDPLLALIEQLADRPLITSQQHYVATFDTKRRCSPYLTYYLHGDTRRRGLALWRIKAALAACGTEPADGELPDHLAVLCELAATGDECVATTLLAEHRPGLTLLRAALEQARSPYAALVAAVEALLPDPDGTASTTAAATAGQLAAAGPPTERVGVPVRTADPGADPGTRR